jgi:hypothetical protein
VLAGDQRGKWSDSSHGACPTFVVTVPHRPPSNRIRDADGELLGETGRGKRRPAEKPTHIAASMSLANGASARALNEQKCKKPYRGSRRGVMV